MNKDNKTMKKHAFGLLLESVMSDAVKAIDADTEGKCPFALARKILDETQARHDSVMNDSGAALAALTDLLTALAEATGASVSAEPVKDASGKVITMPARGSKSVH